MLTKYAINKAIQERNLSYTKIGNTYYFRTNDIETYLNLGKKDFDSQCQK